MQERVCQQRRKLTHLIVEKEMDANDHAKVGIVPRDVAGSMTGLAFLTALLDGSLVRPPFSETMGIRPVELELGRVVFEGTPSERFYNPMGTIHGGWIAALLDTAMACAIQSMLPAGRSYTTLEMKSNFARPVFETTGVLRCEAVVLAMGGRVGSSEGKVLDKEGNLVAHGSETCLIMGPRDGATAWVPA
jgi:uncharacterized protein (TIGR00369 family)